MFHLFLLNAHAKNLSIQNITQSTKYSHREMFIRPPKRLVPSFHLPGSGSGTDRMAEFNMDSPCAQIQ